MNEPKKELAVAALRDGTVIDHIPPEALFKCVRILGLENLQSQLTVGNFLPSERHGRKGIIKVSEVFFPEGVLNRIALVAPDAVVNTIRDYQVVEKRRVELPRELRGIVRCDNPKCITNNEPMQTRFVVVDDRPGFIRCHYCNHQLRAADATIL